MRRAAKVDANQTEIVDALRKAGCSVLPLHQVGGGCPDLLVARAGRNVLIEVKAHAKATLTPAQIDFFDSWRGEAAVVTSAEMALRVVGARAANPDGGKE